MSFLLTHNVHKLLDLADTLCLDLSHLKSDQGTQSLALENRSRGSISAALSRATITCLRSEGLTDLP
jgi:hypothetical protein